MKIRLEDRLLPQVDKPAPGQDLLLELSSLFYSLLLFFEVYIIVVTLATAIPAYDLANYFMPKYWIKCFNYHNEL